MDRHEAGTAGGQSSGLTGQVALVTGGGRGIGRAIARALAAAGAAVAVVARSQAQVVETAALICHSGGCALGVAGDITDRDAVDRLVRQVERELGPVDVLVNNAGAGSAIGPLWEVAPEDWWRDVEVILRGAFLCARAVLPGMIQRRRGRIVNVSSKVALGPQAYATGYATSRAAILRLTDSLAAETAEHGISVFAISPGLVRTAMTEYVLESTAGRKWLPEASAIPTEHWVSAEQAAELVRFLASGQGDGLSGRFIHVGDDYVAMAGRAGEIRSRDLYTLRLRRE